MFRHLLNFIVFIVLICVHEISCDDSQLENDSHSKLLDKPTNPTDLTFTKDSSSLKLTTQNGNANNQEIETFYQKISQHLQSLEENPAFSITKSADHSYSSVQPKSTETINTAKAAESKTSFESRTHSHPVHLVLMKKMKDSKTNSHLLNHKNHFRPISRGVPTTRDMLRISYAAKPGDRTFTHEHPQNRFRRETLIERRLPRQKGGLKQKTDNDKGNFHFRLILRKNSTAVRPNPKLKKLNHPVNLHVLRKRDAVDVNSAVMKQKHNMDREKKIYLENNEILDEDFDSFAKDKMWSSELAKDKLNFYEKKFANASQVKFDERGSIRNNSEGGKTGDGIKKIFQSEINSGSTSFGNVDQSNSEKCGNPQVFSYRYYWCRAKNVFKNFIKLFKSK